MVNIVETKSKEFALLIIKLYKYLVEEKHEYVLSKQILKSGTSIGANIQEGLCAQSKKDFLAKFYISYKESNESLYWLELLYKSNYITDNQYQTIYSQCLELLKILKSITKTTKSNI